MYALLVLDFAKKSHHDRSKSEHDAEYFLVERNDSIVIEWIHSHNLDQMWKVERQLLGTSLLSYTLPEIALSAIVVAYTLHSPLSAILGIC